MKNEDVVLSIHNQENKKKYFHKMDPHLEAKRNLLFCCRQFANRSYFKRNCKTFLHFIYKESLHMKTEALQNSPFQDFSTIFYFPPRNEKKMTISKTRFSLTEVDSNTIHILVQNCSF